MIDEGAGQEVTHRGLGLSPEFFWLVMYYKECLYRKD